MSIGTYNIGYGTPTGRHVPLRGGCGAIGDVSGGCGECRAVRAPGEGRAVRARGPARQAPGNSATARQRAATLTPGTVVCPWRPRHRARGQRADHGGHAPAQVGTRPMTAPRPALAALAPLPARRKLNVLSPARPRYLRSAGRRRSPGVQLIGDLYWSIDAPGRGAADRRSARRGCAARPRRPASGATTIQTSAPIEKSSPTPCSATGRIRSGRSEPSRLPTVPTKPSSTVREHRVDDHPVAVRRTGAGGLRRGGDPGALDSGSPPCCGSARDDGDRKARACSAANGTRPQTRSASSPRRGGRPGGRCHRRRSRDPWRRRACRACPRSSRSAVPDDAVGDADQRAAGEQGRAGRRRARGRDRA